MSCENCANAYDEGFAAREAVETAALALGVESLIRHSEAKASEIARLREVVESLIDECDRTLAWRQATGMRPATDISSFASASMSGVLDIRRTLRNALEEAR